MLLQNNFLQWIFKIFSIIANIVPKCFFLHNLYCKGDIYDKHLCMHVK